MVTGIPALSRKLLLALTATAILSATAEAQRGETTGVARQGGRAGGRAGRGLVSPAGAADQQALVRQVRKRFEALVRRQLALTDDQARRLAGVESRIQPQRNKLARDEHQTRQALRAAMLDSTAAPDQAKISQYLADLVQAQRRRADLLDAEQKELSAFLTPLQRAKYQGLHDQLNKRIQELRKNAGLPDP